MNDRGRDERELVRRCREGSEAAYAELVRRHRPRLYALAYRMLWDREGAEDVVQETFLAAFRAIERVEPRPSLDPWLNTIALRVAGRASAQLRRRPMTSLDDVFDGDGMASGADRLEILDPITDPQAAVEAAELRREVAEAIARLPFKYRAAVVLRHVMGLDYADAAASLGLPLNTFKSRLLRGTTMLREDLAPRLERPAQPAASPADRPVAVLVAREPVPAERTSRG